MSHSSSRQPLMREVRSPGAKVGGLSLWAVVSVLLYPGSRSTFHLRLASFVAVRFLAGGRLETLPNVAYVQYRVLRMHTMNEAGHILVAEDDPTDAYFFERAFRRAGIPVALHFVGDGQQVLDYLKGIGRFADRAGYPLPQLLLLDLKMPRLDGFDVLAWVRKQSSLDGMLVVIFSSSDEPRDINRAYELGANSYLVKPHSMEELTALVGRFKKYWL
jgi:CheY-like chemotaxis protein